MIHCCSNTGKHCISDISISTHPLDRGCTAPLVTEKWQMSAVITTHIWLWLWLSWGVAFLLRQNLWWRGWPTLDACLFTCFKLQVTGGTFWEASVSRSVGQSPACRPARDLSEGCIWTGESRILYLVIVMRCHHVMRWWTTLTLL